MFHGQHGAVLPSLPVSRWRVWYRHRVPCVLAVDRGGRRVCCAFPRLQSYNSATKVYTYNVALQLSTLHVQYNFHDFDSDLPSVAVSFVQAEGGGGVV